MHRKYLFVHQNGDSVDEVHRKHLFVHQKLDSVDKHRLSERSLHINGYFVEELT